MDFSFDDSLIQFIGADSIRKKEVLQPLGVVMEHYFDIFLMDLPILQ